MSTRITVIILNWNGKADTLSCLSSLKEQTVPLDLVVVDNGSEDGSEAAIRQAHPDITLLQTGRNLGYTGGNNVGIRHALATGATHIFVVNNDVVFDPQCVAELLADCMAHPNTAAAAPKCLFESEPDTIYFAGGRILRRGPALHVGLGQPDGPEFDQPGNTDWITGCALFATRQAFERIGPFDDRFFLLFEDVDWSLRACEAGMTLRYVPAARLWHGGSKTFGGKRGTTYQYYFTRNGLLSLERHSFLLLLVPRMMLFLWEARARCYRLGRTPEERTALFRATMLGIKDYLLRRFGQGSLISTVSSGGAA
jgi:GT2 family glycosyltransferase